jgi:starch-binding outer membrane protein, SusD/RagB family
MTRSSKVAAVSLGLVLGASGCGSFLTGDKLSSDPNQPSAATRDQLFVGVQANLFSSQENSVAMTVCMWMQQCAGVGGRFVEQYSRYVVDEFSWDGNWFNVYTGGGLIDLRKIEASARADGDSVYLGVAKIWEAFDVGTAADLWGNIPYTDAVGSDPTPTLDNQAVVYDSVQTLLSQAIADLGGPGAGPGAQDLVYGGVKAKWIAAANTLKARYYLHTVEAAAIKAAVYDSALKYASLGIGAATGDLKTFHTSATSERNIWYQFQLTTFGQDVVAGKFLVDLMKARSDPRLPQYYGKNKGGGYGGQDMNVGQASDSISAIKGAGRNVADFRQPLVTYQENELILAEAYNQTGNDPVALTHLNNARAAAPLPALLAITGPALLDSIMIEKYVALFQNIEVWSDYRRSCVPALTPYLKANPIWRGKIPGRLYYGGTEGNVNSNIPSPAQQVSTNGFRNPNDTADCP